MNEKVTLKDVVDRLDQLISLWKLANIDIIKRVKKEIQNDSVSRKILELADGIKDYTTLSEEVAKATDTTDRTVKSRISYLSEKGALRRKRIGKKVYYESSEIFE